MGMRPPMNGPPGPNGGGPPRRMMRPPMMSGPPGVNMPNNMGQQGMMPPANMGGPANEGPKSVGDWTEHSAPDGRKYYYNNKTKQSKWDKPDEFKSDQDKEHEKKIKKNPWKE